MTKMMITSEKNRLRGKFPWTFNKGSSIQTCTIQEIDKECPRMKLNC